MGLSGEHGQAYSVQGGRMAVGVWQKNNHVSGTEFSEIEVRRPTLVIGCMSNTLVPLIDE